MVRCSSEVRAKERRSRQRRCSRKGGVFLFTNILTSGHLRKIRRDRSCNDRAALQGCNMLLHSCCDTIPWELPPPHPRRAYFVYKDPDVSPTHTSYYSLCLHHLPAHEVISSLHTCRDIPCIFFPHDCPSSLGDIAVRSLSIQPEAPWAANFLILT